MQDSQQSLNDRQTFSERFRCPYFEDGRTAAVEYVLPEHNLARDFHTFLSKGYRRLAQIVYRNICETCSACMPIRLRARSFEVSRSQRRTLTRNNDLRVEIFTPPEITAEKFRLFRKYQKHKHNSECGEEADYGTLISIGYYGYPEILEMNYYLGDRLIGAGIIDEGSDSLSSNYFYYDTDFADRRLGVFSILQEIFLAQSMGKEYYYLGFYIEETSKMSYKRYFRPNQVLDNGAWKDYQNTA